jgi:3-oxoacyl-[acyl-carrier protein] reductase
MSERVALITGVSRRIGIGAAVARHFAAAGYRRQLTGLPGYDDAQPYGGDPDGVPALLAELAAVTGSGEAAAYRPADLLSPAEPAQLVAEAVRRYGRLDVVVAVHAYSTHTRLGALDAEDIDRHLLVNVRATLLLAEAYADQRTPAVSIPRSSFFNSDTSSRIRAASSNCSSRAAASICSLSSWIS